MENFIFLCSATHYSSDSQLNSGPQKVNICVFKGKGKKSITYIEVEDSKSLFPELILSSSRPVVKFT